MEYQIDANGCWVWTGERTGRGYGGVRVGNGMRAAHRVFFEQAGGEIPHGMVLDHLCRNRLCVNPDHLEVVTPAENTLRGVSPCALNARKTHCPKGHPYTEQNTSTRRGRRYCRQCHRDYMRENMRVKYAALKERT